jgi:hypothetical protein
LAQVETLAASGARSPQGLERDLGVRDGAAGGGAERVGDLGGGEPVTGDLDGLAEEAAGVGEGQGGDVVDGDEPHDQSVVAGHVERAVLEEPARAGEVFHEPGGAQDRGGDAQAADVLLDLPLFGGTQPCSR